MNRYEELGFFDFEDFVEELNEEELFSVNGGACGAGSSYNPTPHYGGSCAGGGAVTPLTPPSPPSCGGSFYHGPTQQVCTNPTDYHCDIYAWNEAVKNGLDPRAGHQSEIDLNRATASEMYNYYYKDYFLQTTGRCPDNSKGIAFWDGTNDGIFNPTHGEYFDSVNSRSGEYIQYKTDGIETTVKVDRSLTDSRNANWTYVVLK